MKTKKLILLTISLLYFLSQTFSQSSSLSRDNDPVVIKGSELTGFSGLQPDEIVGFKFESGSWTQISIQVDEMALLDIVTPYGSQASTLAYPASPSNPKIYFYTDPDTETGADPESNFDDDDELVFMAKDAGGQSDGTYPAGVVSNTGQEIKITDPLGGTGYVYLFENAGSLQQDAGISYVTYTSNLSGTSGFPVNNNMTNSENTTITTSKYEWHFSAEWVSDEFSILVGDGSDILDRYKNFFADGYCLRHEDSFSEKENAFATEKAGPIRVIRSYMGANSGPLTQRTHLFYEGRHDAATDLRVHNIPSIFDVFDYNSNADGMTYRNNLNTSGVTIDGSPDGSVSSGDIEWEQITGTQGTVSIIHDRITDLSTPSDAYFTSYYDDTISNPASDCTGDGDAWGSSGGGVVFPNGSVCTDPLKSSCATSGGLRELKTIRTIYADAANGPNNTASTYKNQLDNPLSCSVSAYNYNSDDPVITSCVANKTVTLDSNCEYVLSDYTSDGDLVITNCSGCDVTQSPVAGTVITDTTTVTLTATSDEGKSSDCSFDVNTEENTDPVITACAADTTVILDGECGYVLNDFTADADLAINECSNYAVTQSPAAGTAISDTTTVTLIVTDEYGNSASCSFDVNLNILNPCVVQGKAEFILHVIVQGTIKPSAIFPADVDGDGDLDVVVGDERGPSILSWHENDGSDNLFGPQQIIDTIDINHNRLSDIFVADMDATNGPDILLANRWSNDLLFYANNGAGSFPNDYTESTGMIHINRIVADKLDNDDYFDVLYNSTNDTKPFKWIENDIDGSGNVLSSSQVIESNTAGMAIATLDIDGDNDRDIIASANNDTLCWYENTDGNGTFGPRITINNDLKSINSIVTSDMDGDGIPDIIYASGGNNTIGWYKSYGDGILGVERVVTDTANGVGCLVAVDMDKDGDMDIIAASANNNSISWYDNMDGNGTFGFKQIISDTATDVNDIFVEDLDGDGDYDVLAGQVSSGTVVWYESKSAKITSDPVDENTCPGSDASFTVSADFASGYQWQVDEGTGFADLANDAVYSGVNTTNLHITGVTTGMSGNLYRCIAISGFGSDISAAATLTTEDNTDPVLTTKNATIYLDVNGQATVGVAELVESASDNCSIADTSITGQTAFDCSDVGSTITVNVTVEDHAGNSVTAQAEVTIEDNNAPALVTKSFTVTLDGSQQASIVASDVIENVSDNCSLSDTILSQSEFDCSDVGTATIDVTAVDKSGNSVTEQAEVIVVGNSTPVLTTKNATVELNESGSAVITPSMVVDLVSIDCGSIVDTTLSQSIFNCSDVGTVTIDVSVENNGGDVTTETAEITVQDKIAPVLSVTNIISELDETGNAEIKAVDIIESASDNCSIADTTISGKTSYTCADVGMSFDVNVTITDHVDSTITKTATVTVVDSIAPSLMVSGTNVELNAEGNGSISPADVIDNASDNCNIVDTIITPSVFSITDTGDINVYITVTDYNGNATTKPVIVQVIETVGIQNIADHGIRIYPNPTNGKLKLEFGNALPLSLKIVDISGKTALQLSEINKKQNIDLSGLENGLYMIQLQTENDLIIRSIIKQ